MSHLRRDRQDTEAYKPTGEQKKFGKSAKAGIKYGKWDVKSAHLRLYHHLAEIEIYVNYLAKLIPFYGGWDS